MRFLIILGLLCSCGTNAQELLDDMVVTYLNPPQIKKTDSELMPYYQSFQKVFGYEILNVPAIFNTMETNVAGKCFIFKRRNGTISGRHIEINRDYWNNPKTSENDKLVLMYHELGHCVLNREHVDMRIKIGDYENVPASIMFPNVISGTYFDNNKDYYIDELFNKK